MTARHHGGDEPPRQVPLPIARQLALSLVEPLPAERLPLADARGHFLAEAALAPEPLPRFDNAAMDGYAVRAASARDGRIDLAEAVPIWTGQPVPPGRDAIVPLEACRVDAVQGALIIDGPLHPDQHVRHAGEELQAGATALLAGDRVGPATIGLLTALGLREVLVHRRPRVAILVTGDEVATRPAEPGPGEVRNSNGPMLRALVEAAGGVVSDERQLPDDPDRIRGALAELAADADLLLTSGGASVGSRDHLIAVAGSLGRLICHGLAIRPGRPTSLALIGRTPLVILPGNPFALLAGCVAISLPIIGRLAGDPRPLGLQLTARLGQPLTSHAGIAEFVPVRLESVGAAIVAVPLVRRGSAMLAGAARADGLAVIDAGTTDLAAGALVPVELLGPMRAA